jgi:hypothetical protein
MSAADVLYIDNTNNVWIDGLSNDANGSFINNATCVIVEVLDAAGAQVPGTANISMSYKTASDGDYYGPLPYTVALTENAFYTVRVRATYTPDGGDETRGEWRRVCRAVYRNQ